MAETRIFCSHRLLLTVVASRMLNPVVAGTKRHQRIIVGKLTPGLTVCSPFDEIQPLEARRLSHPVRLVNNEVPQAFQVDVTGEIRQVLDQPSRCRNDYVRVASRRSVGE